MGTKLGKCQSDQSSQTQGSPPAGHPVSGAQFRPRYMTWTSERVSRHRRIKGVSGGQQLPGPWPAWLTVSCQAVIPFLQRLRQGVMLPSRQDGDGVGSQSPSSLLNQPCYCHQGQGLPTWLAPEIHSAEVVTKSLLGTRGTSRHSLSSTAIPSHTAAESLPSPGEDL